MVLMKLVKNTNKVTWELLYKYLEMRMQNGDFTIIDATHSDLKLLNKIQGLSKYI